MTDKRAICRYSRPVVTSGVPSGFKLFSTRANDARRRLNEYRQLHPALAACRAVNEIHRWERLFDATPDEQIDTLSKIQTSLLSARGALWEIIGMPRRPQGKMPVGMRSLPEADAILVENPPAVPANPQSAEVPPSGSQD